MARESHLNAIESDVLSPHDLCVSLGQWPLPRHTPFEGCARLAGAEPQEWARDQIQGSTFIELDVHKATISVALAQGKRGGEVRHLVTVAYRSDHVRKLVDKLAAGGARLHFCYETGPCGYSLHRQLVEMG